MLALPLFFYERPVDMNVKLFLAFCSFFAISIIADESSHNPFDFCLKGVLFRENCKMNPSDPHCQIVGRGFDLNHQNGITARYLESREAELWQKHIKQDYSKSFQHIMLKRKKEDELLRALIRKYFIEKELSSEEFSNDFENGVLELIRRSPEFQNQPKQIQAAMLEQQKELVLKSLGNAYGDEIQE